MARLPDAVTLMRMLQKPGVTHESLANEYGVSRQAVGKKVNAAGGGKAPREKYLPWRVREEHAKRQTPCINAVCWVKWRERGEQVDERERQLALDLEKTCKAIDSVLCYDSEIGFHWHRRRFDDGADRIFAKECRV